MYKIKILSVGKTKEVWLQEGCNEYQKRLSSTTQIQTVWAKDEKQLITWAEKEERLVALDPLGQSFSSESFSRFLHSELEKGGSYVVFLIGGPEGIPSSLKTKALSLISLSSLTFTHQMTRLILMEQIYRALEIGKGSSYHK